MMNPTTIPIPFSHPGLVSAQAALCGVCFRQAGLRAGDFDLSEAK